MLALFQCCLILLLGLVSAVPNKEIGWEEHLQNDLFCGEWNVQP